MSFLCLQGIFYTQQNPCIKTCLQFLEFHSHAKDILLQISVQWNKILTLSFFYLPLDSWNLRAITMNKFSTSAQQKSSMHVQQSMTTGSRCVFWLCVSILQGRELIFSQDFPHSKIPVPFTQKTTNTTTFKEITSCRVKI